MAPDAQPLVVHSPFGAVGIYCLQFPDGRFYIGSSSKVRHRLLEHVGRMRDGKHRNPKLQRAWNRFKTISARQILVCREEDLLLYEQLFMDRLNPGLNLSFIAGRASWSEESRAKQRANQLGKKKSRESVAKMAAAQRGVRRGPQSPEACAKKSAAMMGNKNALGVRLTDAAKAHLAEIMRGNKRALGYKLTAEQRAKQSVGMRGNKNTLGRVRPAEERANISNKMKQIWAQRKQGDQSVTL